MSLYKAIYNKKEKRKQYRGAKLYDKSCRNHGGCPYCENNRMHSSMVRGLKSEEELENLKNKKYNETDI